MKKIFLLLLLIGAAAVITGQPHIQGSQSIDSYKWQGQIKKHSTFNDESSGSLKKRNGITLNKAVLGFLPWWEYYAGTHRNLKYNLLSHIAIFSFEADAEGNLKDPYNWPWIDVINSAKDKNVKTMLTVSNFDPNAIHRLLTDFAVRGKLIENIKSRLKQYGFSGIVIDFENILDSDKEFEIKNFLYQLRTALSPDTYGYEIIFSTPAITFGNWVFPNILEYADYIFIMGYDYYGSWSSTTGPSAPLTGGLYNLTQSINESYSSVPAGKLILGVPYYGNYWKTRSNQAYASVAPYDTARAINDWVKPSLRYREIILPYNQKEKLFDASSKTPWLRWQDSTWNQIWYDDSVSLGLKYDLVIGKKLKGIGIWALGYDDGRPELWNLIEKKFGSTTIVSSEFSNLPNNFRLEQNYPNPFNPETVISYQVPAEGFVQLKIFDLLGREIATVVNEIQSAGVHSVKFSLLNSAIPSGVYIYSLKTDGLRQSRKMVLLK